MTSVIEATFAKGAFQELVRDHVDRPSLLPLSPRDWAFLVGALVFVGRRQDGEHVAVTEIGRSWNPSIPDAWVISRFFLGIGASRDSDYEKARRLFAENFKILRDGQLAEGTRFYVFQGYGFLRHLQSRFAKSARWAERAWRAAFQVRDPIGMSLSLDLRGHNEVQRGLIAKGLRSLAEALEMARSLGHEGFARALEVNIAIYRAQFGWSDNPVEELQRLVRDPRISDTYSRSNLAHELARTLVRQGDGRRALAVLDDSVTEVFRWGHRRQRATHLSRRAHILFLNGDAGEARRLVGEGLALLDEETDLVPRLELTGLTQRLGGEDLSMELARLTRLSGRSISRQILDRVDVIMSSPADDRVGSLLDRLTRPTEEAGAIDEVVERGWLGLLRKFCEDFDGRTRLLLDLVPQRLVLFRRGDVRISRGRVTPVLRLLLQSLARGAMTKQDIVESVWGYQYDSLRHDPMVYTAIHRLRALLGDHEDLLDIKEGLYGWKDQVVVRVHERRGVRPRGDEGIPAGVSGDGLNLRQWRVLQSFGESPNLHAEAYAQKFGVSRPTAVRDLRELVSKGYLKKIGRARATSYVLCPTQDRGEQ